MPKPTIRQQVLVRAVHSAVLLMTSLSLPAFAAEDDAKTLPVVTVTGAAEDSAGYQAKRSATATKTDTALIDTPQSISVITSGQIRDQASPNLQEALRYAPGVRNELYGIDNRADWIALRGSTEATMLLDGLRLPLAGWYGVVRNEPYAFERIEVLRGPSSIIAGENDPGGVVNLVSKRPRAQAAHEIGVRIGNDELTEVHADFTGPLNDDKSLLYRMVMLGKDSGTQVRHADDKRLLLAPSLTWRPNASDLVTVYAEYQYDRSKNTNAFLGLAGTLKPAPHGPIASELFIGEPGWDRYGGPRKRFGYEVDLSLNDAWRLRHNLRHDRVKGLMKSMYAAWWEGFVDADGKPDANGKYMNRLWYVYDDEARLTSSDLLLQGELRTGSVQHTLLLGMDGTLQNSRQWTGETAATPINVYQPVYGVFPEPHLPAGTPSENRVRRLGFLAQDQMKFSEQLSVRAGVRHDKVRNTAVGSPTIKDSATSFNLGTVYQFVPGLAPYASYSESFTPVAGTDAAGKTFKPKRGEQFELGVKWEPASLPLQASAAVYSLKEKNRLADDPNHVGKRIQLGMAKIRGLEAELKADLGAWNVMGNYTYTRARATAGSFGGNLDANEQIEGVPEHTASVWVVHNFGKGFKAGGGARYVGSSGDGTGKVSVSSVSLLDAMASYETGAWRFALNLNNLADKDYIATCLSRGDCWFGQRRRVVLTADYRW